MTTRSPIRWFYLAPIFATVAALPLAAQYNDCVSPPQTVTSFVMEHAVDSTTIQSTLQPNLPPAVVGPITSGAKLIRTRLAYNATLARLTHDLFLVDPGTPIPTPSSVDYTQSIFASVNVNVDKVYMSCTQRPNVMLVGTVASGYPLFGSDPTGSPYAFSFVYHISLAPPVYFGPPPPPTFSDVVSAAGGLALIYFDQAPGSITFTDTSAPMGAPLIVMNAIPSAGGTVAVSDSPYQLDASQSIDPNGQYLTYRWSSDNPAAFWPSNTSPVPLLTFQNGAGNYTVSLVVTNTSGVSSTSKVTLAYLDKSCSK
jgi:hypothetical protein